MADTRKQFLDDVTSEETTITKVVTTTAEGTTTVITEVTNAVYTSTAPQPPITVNNVDPKVGSGIPNTAAADKNNITLAFTPNVLDYYDSYTYHWKLFMVSMNASRTGDILNTAEQTIIAESGVSDLTIDKVEINSIASPSIESGVGTMTTLKFEITEPAGAGLLDQMYYESLSLGIGNWLVTPYYLQLQFRGRDPDTEESIISGGNSGLGALSWVWPIKITGSKINVTNVGTKYEFDAIFFNEVAQSNASFSLSNNTTLNELTNFGSAMDDLQLKLNQDAYAKLIDNYSIADTYTIVVDNILASIPMVNPDDKKSSSRASDYKDLSKRTATFNSGTSVDSIVNSLLGSTQIVQQNVQGSDTPSSKPKTGAAEVSQMKKFWRIVTETRPIAFDSLRQDNALAYTIYIFEYDIGLVDANASQTSVDAATQKKRLNEYMSKKILRKRYNYFFTGLNDQIKGLDLSLNFSFAAAVSRFGGIYIDGQSNSTGITQEENAENEKKAGIIIRDALKQINSAQPNANLDTIISNANKSISDTKISPAVASKYKVLLENAVPGKRTAFTKTIAEGGGIANRGQVGNYDKDGNLLARPVVASLSTGSASSVGNLNFISDVNIQSQAARDAVASSAAISGGKLRPVPLREAAQENNMPGIENTSDSGRARTSSLFATALYSGLDASLMKIKLTIKGDPYWLFPRNTSTGSNPLNYLSGLPPSEAIREIKTAQTTFDSSVNLYNSDNFIIIRMRTPKVYNNETGLTDPYSESETFSGVYKVLLITNRFAGGLFLQDIEAILDPVINFTDIREFIREIEVSSQQMESVTPPVISDISTFATKQQRLTSNAIPMKGQDVSTAAASISNTYGKLTNKVTSNVPYDTNNTSDTLFLPEGP